MEFYANVKDLKKAFSLVALSVGEASETINGHTLFDVKDGKVYLYSTDLDKMSMAYLPISNLSTEGDIQFTADPKKIQKVISSSDADSIKFSYDKDAKTLNIYASEVSDAYISFASFDPQDFLTFDKDLESATIVKYVNAQVFQAGLKFIQGFLPDNDANKKYANLFILDGAMKGSNGSFKVGAFECEDFKGIDVTLRRLMLPAIGSLIDLSEATEISLALTEKLIVISSKDQLSRFAFRKTTITMPKLPLALTPPETGHFRIERNVLLKKLNRLSITSKEEFGIVFKAGATDLAMETIADRKSYEKMPCVGGESTLDFVLECNKFKFVMGFYPSSHVDIYVDNTKCTFFSSDVLVMEEEGKAPVSKPYTAVGIQTLGKKL